MAAGARFELNPRIVPVRAARRAALDQLDYALEGLARGDDEAIHEARKVCKKLRALLRLVRPFLGKAYRAENLRLRDVGRSLAQGREAAVLVQTADRLFAGRRGELADLVERIRSRPRPAVALSLEEARRLLVTERRRVAEWPLQRLSAGSLLVGFLDSYRRARRSYRDARRKRTAAAFHEWRKQAKYHGYQCTLLQPLWPAAGARIKPLKRLSDALGWHHDLVVLSQTLFRQRATFGGIESVRAARRRVAEAQADAERDALKVGRKLFRERPIDWLATLTAAESG